MSGSSSAGTTGGGSVLPTTGGVGGVPASGGAGGGAGGELPGTGGAPPNGGAAPAGGSAGTAGGGNPDAGDTPPVRPLNITAALGEHRHTVGGRPAAVDNRAPKMMGKLIVDLGVDSGGVYQFGLKRGFHVYGAQIAHCEITLDMGRDHNGDCRLETFDGVDRSPSINVTPENSVVGKLTAALKELQATYPEEDWGYFLNADGTVRWSDVGITGVSHGAQSAARWARAVRLYRAVSRSGPRDTACGDGKLHPGEVVTEDMPPYDPNCPPEKISAWQDEVSMTPTERLFGFVGNEDGQFGDILFSMQYMKYIGKPVNISVAQPPYDGSHRFYANDGHSGFDGPEYFAAMGIAWGVPPENMAFAAGQ
jgi:hypothetical protein